MPAAEIFLSTVVTAIFNHLLDQGTDKVEDRIRGKLGLDPVKRAFQSALSKAFKQLQKKYPQWVEDQAFNLDFFKNQAAPILAQFLVRDGHPDPEALAACWADSWNIWQPERRAAYTRELEPVAAYFLNSLAQQLKASPDLQDLYDSRALDALGADVRAIRRSLGAEKATSGTRRDYLRWLIERNLYLDPRGTFQTQRQVQVKLEEVYISLRAQREMDTSLADRYASLASSGKESPLEIINQVPSRQRRAIDLTLKENLSAEELEDFYEQVDPSFIDPHFAPGKVLDLSEVVTHHDRVVILGDPGSGKTVLLRYLALKHAQALQEGCEEASADLGETRFPILVRIAEYAEDGNWKRQALSDFLAQCSALHECPKNGLTDLLQSELEAGRCLMLLDGLDEIVSAEERRGVVERIEDFVRRYEKQGNRFVVTSRVAGYRSAPLSGPFAHYCVQEMDDEQIGRFLLRWCRAVEDAQTPELSPQERERVAQREIEGIMRAVYNSPGVRRLAANPLLLRTLALIHRTGARLPQKRIELYKLAADVLARTWRTAQGVPESALVKEEYLTPILSKLAYWLHVNKPTGIATEREVYAVLGEEWARRRGLPWDADDPDPAITEEIKNFLLAVREHTGLFVERAPRRYGFMHLTFEEYYAARYLVARSRTRAQFIRKHLHDSRWQEPILLALGFVGLEYPDEAGELLETAILAEGEEAQELGFTSSPYEDLFARDYLFALRCLGDDIPVRPDVLKRLLGRMVDELVYHTGLGRYVRYREVLEERLESMKGSLAVSVLGSLFNAALCSDELIIRYRAAEALFELGEAHAGVIETFQECLRSSDIALCLRSAALLCELKWLSDELITVLSTILCEGQIDTKLAIEKFVGHYKQVHNRVEVKLLAILKDGDPDKRRGAVYALRFLRSWHPSIISALIEVLRDSHVEIRRQAAITMRFLPRSKVDGNIVAALQRALEDEDYEVRCYAAESLWLQGKILPEAEDAVLDALHHTDSGIRVWAIRSLSVWMRRMAEESRTWDDRMVLAIQSILQDSQPGVRVMAFSFLGWFVWSYGEREKFAAVLFAGKKDPVPEVRRWTMRFLGMWEGETEAAINAMYEGLHDHDSEVRYQAANSLRKRSIVTDEIREILMQALQKSRNWPVCEDAAMFLGEIGEDEKAIQALQEGLLDTNVRVRAACVLSLGTISRKSDTVREMVVQEMRRALNAPEFEKKFSEMGYKKREAFVTDDGYRGYDYAYDLLWTLLIGDEEEEKKD